MSNSTLENRYMEFRLGNQLFSLPLLNVKEVIQKPEITDVPNGSTYFEGMINLRGQILGVYNIKKRLAVKSDAKLNHQEVVVVVEKDRITIGMIVDEVTRVVHAEPNMIKPAPLKEDDPAKKFISNVIQTESELVLNIDVNTLLEFDKHRKEKAA